MYQRPNAPNRIYNDVTARGEIKNIITLGLSSPYNQDTPGFFPSSLGDIENPLLILSCGHCDGKEEII